MKPKIARTVAALRRETARWRGDGLHYAVVPTMGALHEGHLRLLEVARDHGDIVVATIFVNPLQFNQRQDFDSYPRPVDADLDLCRAAHVDAAYVPTAAAMYPPGFETHVEPGALAESMEGAMRPGHFTGVATVVAKLLNAVRPHVALFGQKDYQQLAVIRCMVRDHDMGIEIIGVATVREPDGLALSSRNRRLSPEDRDAAVAVPRALDAVRRLYEAGERDGQRLVLAAEVVIAAESRARLEYVQVADAESLAPMAKVDRPAVVAIAVWCGDVRLIDNMLLRYHPT